MSPRENSGATGSQGTTDQTEIRVTLARFEAKLDVALAQHGAKLDAHDREIANLREERKEIVANVKAELDEHGRRILSLERTPNVTPKSLMVAMGSTVAILGGFVTFLDRLYA